TAAGRLRVRRLPLIASALSRQSNGGFPVPDASAADPRLRSTKPPSSPSAGTLAAIRSFVGGTSSMDSQAHLGSGRGEVFAADHLDPRTLRAWEKRHGLSPWTRGALATMEVGEVRPGHAMVPPAVLRETALWRELLEPLGIQDMLGIVVSKSAACDPTGRVAAPVLVRRRALRRPFQVLVSPSHDRRDPHLVPRRWSGSTIPRRPRRRAPKRCSTSSISPPRRRAWLPRSPQAPPRANTLALRTSPRAPRAGASSGCSRRRAPAARRIWSGSCSGASRG